MTTEDITDAAIEKIAERIFRADDDDSMKTYLTEHFSVYKIGFEDGIKYAKDIENRDLES